MFGLICTALLVVTWVIFAWIILSYVVNFGRLGWGHPVRRIYDALSNLINPVLEPIRRVLPGVRMGGMALDLSPIILILGVFILRSIVCRLG